MAKRSDPVIRHSLEALAEAILPLEPWVKEPGRYIPPEHLDKPLPWRGKLSNLSIDSLKTISFFEESLAEAHEDEGFIDRFRKLGEKPLSCSPLGEKGIRAWRKERGLDLKVVRFGPATALQGVERNDNIEFAVAGLPVRRKAFWERCFVELKKVFELRKPVGPVEWAHVLKDLLDDKDPKKVKALTGWDPASGVQPSSFIRAFVQELAAILLGGLHDLKRSDTRWNFALAIELGEHRRPGNAFTVLDPLRSVTALKAKVSEVQQRPPK